MKQKRVIVHAVADITDLKLQQTKPYVILHYCMIDTEQEETDVTSNC